MKRIGGDRSGVTDESVSALTQVYMSGLALESIDIEAPSSLDVVCRFNFQDGRYYEASGFSIGFGGSGPNGLRKMIDLFNPGNKSSKEALKLPYGKWRWTLEEGFKDV